MTFQTKDGPRTVFICGGKKPKLCPFCHDRYVTRLCDFMKLSTVQNLAVTRRRCDNGMCDECATNIGLGLDYCPIHKDEAPPAQNTLFGDAQ
jgi:hypothetical protein